MSFLCRLARAGLVIVVSIPFLIPFASAADKKSSRKLEEVVVYGQKTEATVKDTSVSLTALSENFIKDMGLQGPNDLINFIPATTRTAWDVKIRGIGRNFRGLGGDPGVGTYYDGIYSPDFGIAATEAGLYDIKRIEVLRGPQGTLYGRESIGGVINYVTSQPNHDGFEAKAQVILGEYDANEWYGVVTGPITDKLAVRLMGSKRGSHGHIKGFAGTQSMENTNDQDTVLTVDYEFSPNLSVNLRSNYRFADNRGNFGNGGATLLSEGPCISTTGAAITSLSQCDPKYRVNRDISYYEAGYRPVASTWPGAIPFTNPIDGTVVYASNLRPGVDRAVWPYEPSPNFDCADCKALNYGNTTTPDIRALTNRGVDQKFRHQSNSVIIKWNINDNYALNYLFNYQHFDYYFDRDNDFSDSKISSMGDTVLESVWSFSHELRFFWNIGNRWSATSGFYNFLSSRRQHYGIRNRLAKGYTVNPTLYGPANDPNWVLNGLANIGWIFPPCFDWKTAAVGAPGGYGAYCGDPGVPHQEENDTGAVYEHDNHVRNVDIAYYTQGDLKITDNFSVTLGLRYSKQWRNAMEARGGYSEIELPNTAAWSWIPYAMTTAAPAGYNTAQFYAPGVTPLAALNVALGAATFTGDPNHPIASVCPLTATYCARPLRLGGIPISWGSRAPGRYDTSRWTYRVNFNWTPTDNSHIYFGVTTGYRAGGYDLGNTDNRATVFDPVTNTSQTVLLQYKDETLTNYEAGYKGTLLDDTLSLDLSVYYYDYKNYQDTMSRWETTPADFSLPAGVPPPAGRGPVYITGNVPHAVNHGFEGDISWFATDSLSIGGNWSYTISKYETAFNIFNNDDPRYPLAVFNPSLSQDPCSLAPSIRDLYCRNVKGVQLAGIPKVKVTGWVSYRWQTSLGRVNWYVSDAYTGKYNTNLFARPWDEVPARFRIDSRVTLTAPNDHWKVSFFVDNLLNRTYARWSDMDPRLTGYGINFPQRMVTIAPRYWGLQFNFNYGDYH